MCRFASDQACKNLLFKSVSAEKFDSQFSSQKIEEKLNLCEKLRKMYSIFEIVKNNPLQMFKAIYEKPKKPIEPNGN